MSIQKLIQLIQIWKLNNKSDTAFHEIAYYKRNVHSHNHFIHVLCSLDIVHCVEIQKVALSSSSGLHFPLSGVQTVYNNSEPDSVCPHRQVVTSREKECLLSGIRQTKPVLATDLRHVVDIIWIPESGHFQETSLHHSSRGLLGCDAAYYCGRIPTFQRSMLPPSSGRGLLDCEAV
jgi:hypothetical protein